MIRKTRREGGGKIQVKNCRLKVLWKCQCPEWLGWFVNAPVKLKIWMFVIMGNHFTVMGERVLINFSSFFVEEICCTSIQVETRRSFNDFFICFKTATTFFRQSQSDYNELRGLNRRDLIELFTIPLTRKSCSWGQDPDCPKIKIRQKPLHICIIPSSLP